MNLLSEKLRPSTLDEVVGQEHLLGKDGWLKRTIEAQKPLSILLFGPPGSGKTTIARLYAKAFKVPFKSLSAVFSGVADLKKIVQEIKLHPLLYPQTILFIDEIHRFNKAQQDAFLPYIEDGTIVLVGATTENPSFSLNNALLSRLTILTLNALNEDSLEKILDHYEKKIGSLKLGAEEKKYLIELAHGDGRYLLNMLENLQNYKGNLTLKVLPKLLQRKASLYDKHSEYHFNLISAFHKAIRGSDPDSAIYWLARIFEGGEDPLYIARRMIRIASEDIGLADPQALNIALTGYNTYHLIGSPEGDLSLAQVAIYLALAPKSNRTYLAFKKALELAKKTHHLSPPPHILNAPTQLMKDMGFAQGYVYDHDLESGFSGQNYFPSNFSKRESLYSPVERGFEREMKKRMDYFNHLRKNMSSSEKNN